MHFLQHVISQVVEQLFGNKISHKEVILLKQFLNHPQMTGFIAVNNILEDEHDPLRNVHLEQSIFSDKFSDNLVNGIVQFHELIALVVLVRKDFLLDVHFHVEKQLEEQLADA